MFGSVAPPAEADRQIGLAMQGYWTRLAANGDPNGEDVAWPGYDDASDQRINFDTEITVLSGFRRTECEFWSSVYDQQFE